MPTKKSKRKTKPLPKREESVYQPIRNKTPLIEKLLIFVAWLSGFLVSISVGYAMILGVLPLPEFLGGATVSAIVGWIVIVSTVLSVIFSFFRK
jgi:hypothetical protein